jgi:hypothetical protein
MKQNNIIQLPVDQGFPIQSAPLTEEDTRLILAFIKKSKANHFSNDTPLHPTHSSPPP